MRDLGAGEQLGAVAHGVGQIGHGDGVLGADVAAAAAIAATDAGRLLDAAGADGVVETDDDLGCDRITVDRAGGLSKRLDLGVIEGLGIACGREPASRELVTFVELAVLGNLAGPDGVLEDARVGAQRDAGVDQGTAAEAAANQDVHVVAEAHVEETLLRSNRDRLAGDAHFLAHLRKAGGEFACHNFAPAFQHGNVEAGAGEARGGHAAAVTGADDQDVVRIGCITQRSGKAGGDGGLLQALRTVGALRA